MTTHTVAQGETLLTIAKHYEFRTWRPIWEHADNAELRRLRVDPMVLAPGDEVVIPEKEPETFSCETNNRHTFRLKELPCVLTLTLRDETNSPYADCSYELVLADQTLTGRTTSEGLVVQETPHESQEATLRLWPAEGEEPLEWQLMIGHLDPLDSISGVQARLNNLGFQAGEVTGELNEQTRTALEDYQRSIGIDPPTGEVDDATRAALANTHDGR